MPPGHGALLLCVNTVAASVQVLWDAIPGMHVARATLRVQAVCNVRALVVGLVRSATSMWQAVVVRYPQRLRLRVR